MNPKKRRNDWVLWVAVGFALIVSFAGIYGAAYVATVSPDHRMALIYTIPGGPRRWPVYTVGGDQEIPWLETFFGPANFIDRRMRPEIWIEPLE